MEEEEEEVLVVLMEKLVMEKGEKQKPLPLPPLASVLPPWPINIPNSKTFT